MEEHEGSLGNATAASGKHETSDGVSQGMDLDAWLSARWIGCERSYEAAERNIKLEAVNNVERSMINNSKDINLEKKIYKDADGENEDDDGEGEDDDGEDEDDDGEGEDDDDEGEDDDGEGEDDDGEGEDDDGEGEDDDGEGEDDDGENEDEDDEE